MEVTTVDLIVWGCWLGVIALGLYTIRAERHVIRLCQAQTLYSEATTRHLEAAAAYRAGDSETGKRLRAEARHLMASARQLHRGTS